MARGAPDGKISDFEFASQVSDLGSIASMLWGFSPLDGRGRVVYFDTFNNGMAGWQSLSQGNGFITNQTSQQLGQRFLSPPRAVVFQPLLVANDFQQIHREMFFGKALRIGIEAGFTMGNTSPNQRLAIDYNPVSGSPYFGTMQFSHSLGAWQVWTPAAGGSYQTFYTPGLPGAGTAFIIQVKLIMDFETGKYVRALIGDQDFDLSAISMGNSSSAYNGMLIASFRATSYGAGTSSTTLGYMLITKDEP